MRREMMYRAWFVGTAMVLLCQSVVGAGVPPDGVDGGAVFPVDERLSYAVSYLGVHCGRMEITSFIDRKADGEPMARIVLLARTTKFFDGIYRLRSRLDSFFDPRRMTSVRYEEHSLEKKKRKDEVWDVDEEAGEVVRTKNGKISRIPVNVARAFDPLAFIYSLRSVNLDVGGETTVNLMTSKGSMETVVRAKEVKRIRTKMGRCDAIAMVPEPRDKMMFSKSGSMTVWIDRSAPNRPCKIEFELSFGTLVASLTGFEKAPEGPVGTDWENWDGSKGEDR